MSIGWHMVMALGYGADVRKAVTLHCHRADTEALALDILESDRDAERAVVLKGRVLETGIRMWDQKATYRRRADGGVELREHPA